eukprot:1025546-Prymnesium_polylepis.4
MRPVGRHIVARDRPCRRPHLQLWGHVAGCCHFRVLLARIERPNALRPLRIIHCVAQIRVRRALATHSYHAERVPELAVALLLITTRQHVYHVDAQHEAGRGLPDDERRLDPLYALARLLKLLQRAQRVDPLVCCTGRPGWLNHRVLNHVALHRGRLDQHRLVKCTIATLDEPVGLNACHTKGLPLESSELALRRESPT